MKGSLKIGTVGGVPIRLHWSLVILVLFAVGPGVTAKMALSESAWIVVVFACVFVHELTHSLLARHRGFKVRDIVLMPLGGFSEIIGIARSPGDEAAISLAGPLANCVIAAVLCAVAASLGMRLWPPTLFARSWLVRIVWANVALAGLNLLPALPLDGGRVLRGYLGRAHSRVDATRLAARTATIIATVMIAAGLLVDLWIALVGVFVLFGARAEQQAAAAGAVFGDLKVRAVMVPGASGLAANEPMAEAAPFLRRFPYRAFAVLDDNEVIGVIAADDLADHPHASTVREATDTLTPLLEADDVIYPTAFDAFAESNRKALAVKSEGHPAGVLYASDLESRLEQSRAHAPR